MIDGSNRTGTMEFNVPQRSDAAFFPVRVSFSSPRTFCDVGIAVVSHAESGAPIKFSMQKALAVDSYLVGSE